MTRPSIGPVHASAAQWPSHGIADPNPWHGGGFHHRFVRYYYAGSGYYPQAVYDSAPDYADSADSNAPPPSSSTAVYYVTSPPPPQLVAYPAAPVAAAPVVPSGPPRLVHGTLWKYTVGGVITYTNIKPPASSGAKTMFSYTETCAASCSYTSDN